MPENQLQKTNTDLVQQKQHILLNPPAFKDDYNTVYNELLTSVARAYADLNFAVPVQKEIDIMVASITKNIQDKYKQIRTEEIATAIFNGVRKEYGEYMGLSVITFEIFIKGYLNSSYRMNLAKSVPQLEAPKEPTREEKFNLAAFNAIQAFLSYSNSKDITLVAPSVYRFLRKLELVSYEEEEQAEFIAQAEKEVKEELLKQKTKVLDKNKRLEIGRMLEAPQTLEQKIILHAQRLGLYAYFQTLIMEETDLRVLIVAKKQYIL